MSGQAGRILACGLTVAVGAAMPAWAHGTTELVSVSSGGAQANSVSRSPAISADGRFIAFESDASNLVPGDINGLSDMFVRDRQTGTTEQVSVGPGGVQGNGGSYEAALSASGRFVAFASEATNLVPGDSNSTWDVFVHDRETDKTRRVSVSSGGAQGNDSSGSPSISANGRFVAFRSDASNLVPGDTNNADDIFVHDRQTGKTRQVSVSSGGAQGNGDSYGPSISGGGRSVAFVSFATNLVPGDTNGERDIFVHDRETRKTGRVNVNSGGAQGKFFSDGSSISANGRFVAFSSRSDNLVPGGTNKQVHVFVHDRQTGRTQQVSVRTDGAQANGFSTDPAISANGRFVAFETEATNLVPGDTDDTSGIFIHDRQTGRTRQVSVSSAGTQANGFSADPAISANGRFVAFYSPAINLVPDDTNNADDIFVRTLAP